MGNADLPIAVVTHPFGAHSRERIRALAEQCANDIAKLACGATAQGAQGAATSAEQTREVEVAHDLDSINLLFRERRWADGLPIVPPTSERVQRMLRHTMRPPQEVIATLPPGFGAATAELIAVNAVMAGCDPEYLPLLIAAIEAAAAPEFNLQAIQATTNPAAVWLIVSGPIVQRLGMNAGVNCLGQGNWANATLGRALRLVLQNVGRALPGDMDLATHGQPGKYLFCCPENEAASPWEPLHVEHGYTREQSAVTVVGAEGTVNMNTQAKDANELIQAFALSMPRPTANDYRFGRGGPWIIISPEHAECFRAAGLSKAQVKQRLWNESKMPARLLVPADMRHIQDLRRSDLGTVTPDTLLAICRAPEDLGIIVAGGPGTHSVYVSSFGVTRAVTREITGAN